MKKRFVIAAILLIAIGVVFASSQPSSANITRSDLANEGKYLPMAREFFSQTVGDVNDYGSFRIERTHGMKFVLELAKEDEKSDLLVGLLKKHFPQDLLEITTGYKYPVSDLLKINMELATRWKELNSDGTSIVETVVDEAKDKVVINANKMTEETRSYLDQHFGEDKIEIVIDQFMSIQPL